MRAFCFVLIMVAMVTSLSAESGRKPAASTETPNPATRIEELENRIQDLLGQLTLQRISAASNQDVQIWRAEMGDRLNALEKQLGELRANMAQLGEHRLVNDREDPSGEMLATRNGAIYLPQPSKPKPENAKAVTQESSASLPVDPSLAISGFMDAVYELHSRGNQPNRAYLNQVEIDLLRDLSPRTSLALSLCYSDAIRVGAATITQKLVAQPENPSSRVVQEWAMTGGQFDIPFGLDFQYYCSNARQNITAPAIVHETHKGWNDLGLMSALSTRWGILHAYATRGFESKVWHGEEPLTPDIAEDDERWIVSIPDYSGGFRLSIPISGGVEIGGSVARSWLGSGARSSSLAGVHLQGTWRSLRLKTEGISCMHAESLSPEHVRGYYVELNERVGRWIGVGRMDYVERPSTGVAHGYSVGTGVQVIQGLQCRAEYRHMLPESEGTTYLQFVAEF